MGDLVVPKVLLQPIDIEVFLTEWGCLSYNAFLLLQTCMADIETSCMHKALHKLTFSVISWYLIDIPSDNLGAYICTLFDLLCRSLKAIL